MHQVIARCRTGSSHITRHKPCQDRLCHVQTHDFTLVAVADGHGSPEYSRSGIGARFAVYAAQKVLPSDAPDEEVVADIKWLYDHMVARHMARHPLSDREMALLSAARLHPVAAYGCTLAAAVIDYNRGTTSRYCLGDSDVVFIDASGHFPPPLPEDPACVGSATSSMCQSPETVKEHFRIQHLGIMAAVGVYSDGAEAEDWRAAEVLFSKVDEASEESMENRVEKLLKVTDHGDDQTFVLAVEPDAVSTDDFQAGVAEEIHRGHQVMALNRLVEKRKQAEVYLRLLLEKAKRLSVSDGSEAVKFKDEVLRPAAEEFATLNKSIEVLRMELEEVP